MKYKTIKNNRDFVKAYKKGKRTVGKYLVLYMNKTKSNETRVGITVSKKVGNAVKRNRVRRLIRQAIYSNYYRLKPGYDYVFVARVRANNTSLNIIESNVVYSINKLVK